MDDLNRPLGVGRRPSRVAGRDIPYGVIAVAGCGVLLASLAVFSYIVDDKHGGEPYASAVIEAPVAKVAPPVNVAAADVSNEQTSSISRVAKSASAEQVEQASGVKVVRGGNGKVPGAMVIEIPDRGGVQLNPSPDKRVAEQSKQGILPKSGADGATPLSIYARPLLTSPTLKVDAPRVAIVFAGLGLADGSTQDAISVLPGEVTLAFAPYGKALERQVQQARDAGHEVLLQVPMQSFDYPANNPGPETLLSDADEGVNIRNLRNLMVRFTGYVGVMTYQGGKFTSERGPLAPILRETAGRGLMMLDDGSSPRSVISAVAPEIAAPFARGDVILDASPKSDAVAAALTKLEAKARQNGSAIGIANGYPASIDQIATWAKSLEARGIALVPVSVLAGRSVKPVAESQQ